MRSILKTAVASAAILALSTGSVAATGSGNQYCENYDTGNDSYNKCVNDRKDKMSCENNNNTWVENENNQSSKSGSSLNKGNRSGDGASSGPAENTNETKIDVYNEGSCAPKAQPSSTTTKPSGGQGGGGDTAPVVAQGGRGGASSPSAAPEAAGGVGGGDIAALPETGNETVMSSIAMAVSGVSVIAIATQAGRVLVRRYSSL
jgi:hypothetical protein